MNRPVSILAIVATLAGCSMAPKYDRPGGAVPPQFPQGAAYAPLGAETPGYTWAQTYTDPRLRALVSQALEYNQDVALALANVAAARAQYAQQRAQQLPQLGVSAGYSRSGGNGNDNNQFSLQAQVPSYELDLFGRLRSLSDAAKQRYLGSIEAQRGARLTLIAEVGRAWVNHAADASLLAVAQDTAKSAAESLRLNRLRLAGGVIPRTDVRQAEIVLRTAEADVADLTTALVQDRNALRLLLGSEPDPANLPGSIAEADAGIAMVPAGLDSAILLRRPAVREA
jgi:multidrug efflux system outer membrane protein